MDKSRRHPPKLGQKLLSLLGDYESEYSICGDCSEEFQERVQEGGRQRALLWYWWQVIYALAAYSKRSVATGGTMLSNYFKITWRNIKKHKIYSFINIMGLAMGMAVCIIILLWVQDELSYDRFHKNADRIFRVITETRKSDGDLRRWAITPWPLGAALLQEYPEVINFTRYRELGRRLISYKDKRFYENAIFLADPSFLETFSFPLIKGDPATALSEGVVITEEIARKYFGEEDPLGEILTSENQNDFVVTGIIKVPRNSHLQFDFLLPLEKTLSGSSMKGNWGSYDVHTFILLDRNVSVEDFKEKIYYYLLKRSPETTSRIRLQALTDMHLHSDFYIDLYGPSRDTSVYITIFSLIAVFILLIACINFVNLTVARASTRSKEVGLRKIVGAKKRDMMAQFFGESVFLTIISFIFALVLINLFLPLFNNLAGKELTLNPFDNGVEGQVLFLLLVFVFTGVVTGIYPALIQSSYQPVNIFRGNHIYGAGKSGSSLLRKVLVVLQFTCSIALIIGTLVINQQFNYIQDKKLGYEKDHLLYFTRKGEISRKYDTFKKELLKNPGILSVTTSSDVPIYTAHATIGIDWEGKSPDSKLLIHHFSVDSDYIKTLNMKITSGRDFSKEFTSDAQGTAFILNEAAVKAMDLHDPVGKWFRFWEKKGNIIGVVEDFHYKSLHSIVEPLVLRIDPSWCWYVFVKLSSRNIDDTVNYVKGVYRQFNPHYPFEYRFLDIRLDRLYDNDRKTFRIFQYFTSLAILISCLGLFGLAAYTVQRRTKEIGIRRVIGASAANIIQMLSKEFLVLVIAGNILAWPIAYFAMNKWLQSFAYRTSIGPGTFIFSGLLALFIALCTIIYQSIKAANINPVDAIRYE